MAEIIRTENLQYAYPADEGAEPVLALKGVDLTIEQGSFVVVLGHNGSGKSTLAKTLNGVLLPCGGHVYVEGMDTLDEHLLLAIRRTVGMVFQNPDNQIVANVVEEDVAFAPENLGVSSREIRQRVDDALAAVGMGEFARHAPHLLSGGQKQRIAIAGHNRFYGTFFYEDSRDTEQNGGKAHVGTEISGICEKGKISGDIG